MNPLSTLILAMALLPGSSLVPCGAYANTRPIEATAADNPAIADWSAIQYARGLLDGQIENVPLGKVLSELARKSGVQVHFIDPVIAQWSVSASLKGVPFVEGIKRILDGFSYATYRGADISGIIVLSTQPDPARTGIKTAGTGLMRVSLTAAPDKRSPTLQDPGAAPFIPMAGEGVPQSLDELQPITMEAESLGPMEEVGQEVDPAAQLAKEQEYNEALLRRALYALESEHRHLHREAINQLQGMKDPRATQALAEAASSTEGKDSRARVQAVETLWRHTADLKFRDEGSINVLTRLAEDNDTRVAEIARQALRSMQQYQKQQNTMHMQ